MTVCGVEEVLLSYDITKYVFYGNTIEEVYDNMNLFGREKPDKEEFCSKVSEAGKIILIDILRIERNKKLAESDWTQSRDVNLHSDEEWQTYRQALRDLPANSTPELDENGELTNITWPTPPS